MMNSFPICLLPGRIRLSFRQAVYRSVGGCRADELRVLHRARAVTATGRIGEVQPVDGCHVAVIPFPEGSTGRRAERNGPDGSGAVRASGAGLREPLPVQPHAGS